MPVPNEANFEPIDKKKVAEQSAIMEKLVIEISFDTNASSSVSDNTSNTSVATSSHIIKRINKTLNKKMLNFIMKKKKAIIKLPQKKN